MLEAEVINMIEGKDDIIEFLAKTIGPLVEEEFRREEGQNCVKS